MKRLLALSLFPALLLAGCAAKQAGTTAEATPQEVKAPPLDPREDALAVAAKLREITLRVRQGESAMLRQEFTERLAANPDDVRARFFLAWIDVPNETSFEKINGLAKLNQDEPWLRTAIGVIYLRWGGTFLSHARSELDRAVAKWPGFLPAKVALADVKRLSGDLAGARSDFEAVVQREPRNQEAQLGLGQTLWQLGDGASARRSLQAALELDGSDLAALRLIVEVLKASGDRAAAIPYQERLIELERSDSAALLTLGKLREETGDLEGAAETYEKVFRAQPTADTARLLVALYAKLGQPAEEARMIEDLIQIDQAATDPLLRLSELKKADGDLEGAQIALRQASDRAPDDLKIQVMLARMLKERSTLIPTIEFYRQAVKKGARELSGELRDLEKQALVPVPALRGNVQRLYNLVYYRLIREYEAHQKLQPNLAGKLGVRITIAEGGSVSNVEFTENTLHDDVLSALVYFSLRDAELPGERPRSVSFVFELSKAN